MENEWGALKGPLAHSHKPPRSPLLNAPDPQTGRQQQLDGKEDQVEAETESANFTQIGRGSDTLWCIILAAW